MSNETYGPFERSRTYELEFRARAEHRAQLVNQDLSAAQLQVWWRLYETPASPQTFIVSEQGTKLVEASETAGANGLWKVTVTIPKTAPLGAVVYEAIAVDTAVNNADTPSGKREIPLAPPVHTSIVEASRS